MSEKDTDIVYFISFCLEQYKVYKQLSGTEVSELFDQYHVYDYLTDNYDVLHTQGHQWLNLDIDQFIKERK